MELFEYENDEAARLHRELIKATDGTEPCFDPFLVSPENERIYESHTDRWVENFNNRGMTQAEAEEMCAGCHVIEECLSYAVANEEAYGVWGGTTARTRGYYRGKKIKNKRTGVWE